MNAPRSSRPGLDAGPAGGASRTRAAWRRLVRLRSWIGCRLDDASGARVGNLRGVYLDGVAGEPLWLVVRLGLFSERHTAVAFEGAVLSVDRIRVPHERATIRSAPSLIPARPLSPHQEARLRRHYGLPAAAVEPVASAGRPYSGPGWPRVEPRRPKTVGPEPPTSYSVGGRE